MFLIYLHMTLHITLLHQLLCWHIVAFSLCQLHTQLCVLHASSACDSSIGWVGASTFQAFGPSLEVKAALTAAGSSVYSLPASVRPTVCHMHKLVFGILSVTVPVYFCALFLYYRHSQSPVL